MALCPCWEPYDRGASRGVDDPPWRARSSLDRLYVVEHVLEVSIPDSGLGGILLREAPVAVPWEKDYDSIEGEGPTRWPKRFDTSSWGLIGAHDEGTRVGGAVIAMATPGVKLLDGRPMWPFSGIYGSDRSAAGVASGPCCSGQPRRGPGDASVERSR